MKILELDHSAVSARKVPELLKHPSVDHLPHPRDLPDTCVPVPGDRFGAAWNRTAKRMVGALGFRLIPRGKYRILADQPVLEPPLLIVGVDDLVWTSCQEDEFRTKLLEQQLTTQRKIATRLERHATLSQIRSNPSPLLGDETGLIDRKRVQHAVPMERVTERIAFVERSHVRLQLQKSREELRSATPGPSSKHHPGVGTSLLSWIGRAHLCNAIVAWWVLDRQAARGSRLACGHGGVEQGSSQRLP